MSSLIQDNRPEAVLALADGTLFRGRSIGAPGRTIAEVVFNTSMTGYQEILTDPSYTVRSSISRIRISATWA